MNLNRSILLSGTDNPFEATLSQAYSARIVWACEFVACSFSDYSFSLFCAT